MVEAQLARTGRGSTSWSFEFSSGDSTQRTSSIIPPGRPPHAKDMLIITFYLHFADLHCTEINLHMALCALTPKSCSYSECYLL